MRIFSILSFGILVSTAFAVPLPAPGTGDKAHKSLQVVPAHSAGDAVHHVPANLAIHSDDKTVLEPSVVPPSSPEDHAYYQSLVRRTRGRSKGKGKAKSSAAAERKKSKSRSRSPSPPKQKKKSSKSTNHHCPKASKGNCRNARKQQVTYCSKHQTVCEQHSQKHLKDEDCPRCPQNGGGSSGAE